MGLRQAASTWLNLLVTLISSREAVIENCRKAIGACIAGIGRSLGFLGKDYGPELDTLTQESVRLKNSFQRMRDYVQMTDPPSWEEYRLHLLSEMERFTLALNNLTIRIEHLEKAVVKQAALSHEQSRNISIIVSGIISVGVMISRLAWEIFFHR